MSARPGQSALRRSGSNRKIGRGSETRQVDIVAGIERDAEPEPAIGRRAAKKSRVYERCAARIDFCEERVKTRSLEGRLIRAAGRRKVRRRCGSGHVGVARRIHRDRSATVACRA